MRLSKLLDVRMSARIADIEITHLTADSKQAKVGSLFFAINGINKNGEDYISEALRRGAAAVLTQNLSIRGNRVIYCEDVRKSMALCASRFYSVPTNDMVIITVVGTNGKTTTANILYKILSSRYNCGIIGTLGASWLGKQIVTNMTTPDSIELFSILRQMRNDGVTHVVMELSAHAIYYNKTYGMRSDLCIFTNILQDHLDFFNDMGTYAQAKLDYLASKWVRHVMINMDNEYAQSLLDARETEYTTYGILNQAEISAFGFCENDRQSFVIKHNGNLYNINTRLKGVFNRYNLLASFGAALRLGIDSKNIIYSIQRIEEIPGRYNQIKGKCNIVIDYAHTPDGLKNILSAVKSRRGRIICVFGCGGNRDKTKREIMGRISLKYADVSVVTSDNPRHENPQDIIEDIVKFAPTKFITILDRKNAISYAYAIAECDDTILIAGKGCEDYMEIRGEKIHYSDYETIYELIEGTRNYD